MNINITVENAEGNDHVAIVAEDYQNEAGKRLQTVVSYIYPGDRMDFSLWGKNGVTISEMNSE